MCNKRCDLSGQKYLFKGSFITDKQQMQANLTAKHVL